MPESKGRKRPRPNPNRAVPRKSVMPKYERTADMPDFADLSRDPAKPLPPEQLYEPIELPEPASYDQVLVALSELDPLAQEVMIAERLAMMPHPGDPKRGMPVHIERMARGPWAHHLRKLGIFCVPELAVCELVATDRTGTMRNHTAMSTRRIGQDDLLEVVRQQNPAVGEMVDAAKTPAEKREAARILMAKLPVAERIALERILSTAPEDLEPS
jgi:hypothetical protein